MEKLCDFDNDCVELLMFYDNLLVKICVVDCNVIVVKGDVVYIEEEFVVCYVVG